MKKNKIYDRDFKVSAVKLGLETNFLKASTKLGVPYTNLYRWRDELQKYGAEGFCERGHFRTPEQKKFSELKKTLKRKLKYAILEVEIFRNASKYIVDGKPMIFHFIEQNIHKYPLSQMCKVLGIGGFTYYRWRDKLISPRQLQTDLINKEITSIFYEYKKRYGNGKICAELQSRGFKLKKCSVSIYMRKLGLVSKLSCKHKIKSDSPSVRFKSYVFPNVLNQIFKADGPSQVWVTGITSIETVDGLIYLTIIMDLFDRKIIGWNLSEGLTSKETSMPAWEKAVLNRKIKNGLIFHSDRSSQYANGIVTRKIESFKHVIRSMSRTAHPLDNPIPRSFFAALKSELINLNMLLTKKKMEEKISEYIKNLH